MFSLINRKASTILIIILFFPKFIIINLIAYCVDNYKYNLLLYNNATSL